MCGGPSGSARAGGDRLCDALPDVRRALPGDRARCTKTSRLPALDVAVRFNQTGRLHERKSGSRAGTFRAALERRTGPTLTAKRRSRAYIERA
jgi:hypothetical protein